MALKKIVVGARVMITDNENRVMFTKGDWDSAKARYTKELTKKIVKQQQGDE